jgi:hypothetical protein
LSCSSCRNSSPTLQRFAQNQIWCELVAMACELLAWTQMLVLTGTARRWEPKRLRLRLFTCAGRLVRSGRRQRLRLALGHSDHHRDQPPGRTRTRLIRSSRTRALGDPDVFLCIVISPPG